MRQEDANIDNFDDRNNRIYFWLLDDQEENLSYIVFVD